MDKFVLLIMVCFVFFACSGAACIQEPLNGPAHRQTKEGIYRSEGPSRTAGESAESAQRMKIKGTRVIGPEQDKTNTVSAEQVQEANERTAPGEKYLWDPATVRDSYKIDVGDELEIIVPGHDEVNGKVTVRSSGEIFVPMSNDRLEAFNTTPEQLAGMIKEKIQKFFTEDDLKVHVSLIKSNSKYCFVFGEVYSQGKMVMTIERMTLKDVLINAGMIKAGDESSDAYYKKDAACLDRVRLIRPDKKDPTKAKYWVVDARDFLYYGLEKNNYVVRPGDVVLIPSSFDKKLNDVLSRINKTFGLGRSVDFDITDAYRRTTGHKISPAP